MNRPIPPGHRSGNPGSQAAILATGRIADAVAAVNNGITIRKRMFLSLSYDHRIVDGATAARFLQRVRQILEEADFQP